MLPTHRVCLRRIIRLEFAAPLLLHSSRAGAKIPSDNIFLSLVPTQSRIYSSETVLPLKPPSRSLTRRFLSFIAISIVFSSAGFIMATAPIISAINDLISPPSDAETLRMYAPEDELANAIDNHIINHPIAQSLRANSDFVETRPHLKIPEAARVHNLTGGTLLGPRKIVVPPLYFFEKGGKSCTILYYLGEDLCGHPGIVHGGMLATLLDEGMARSCFAALPNKVGLTASLTVNYKAPVATDNYVCLKATTTKVEGRKAWVDGRIESLVADGETPVVYVEAKALFIEPRQAATMARIYPAVAASADV